MNDTDRVLPLTADERRLLSAPRRGFRPMGYVDALDHAITYAINQSQEPSETEIEMVAFVVGMIDPPLDVVRTPEFWRWYTGIARAAIRAVRGLDAEPTP